MPTLPFGWPSPYRLTLAPTTGSPNGNQQVQINGTHLLGATQVMFGTAAATIGANTDSAITVTTPVHVIGAVTVSVTTAGGTASAANGFTYRNLAPALTSAVTVTPATPYIGRPVSVTIPANDPDGDQVYINGDWGDGTAIVDATTTTLTHTYTAAGPWTVTLNLSDKINPAVTVTPSPVITLTPLPAFTPKKVSGSFKFGSTKPTDVFSISGTLPNVLPKQPFASKAFVVEVGGLKATFALDSKGKGKGKVVGTISGTVGLTIKYTKNKDTKVLEFLGGDVPFKVALKGIFAQTWLTNQIIVQNTDMVAKTIYIPITFTLDGIHVWGRTQSAVATSKAHKSGKFK